MDELLNNTCEIIIEFIDINDGQKELINRYGVIKHYFPMINSYVVELPKKLVPNLEQLDGVVSVFENTHITAQMNNGRRAVRADSAHSSGHSGMGATIAFLDTGIAPIKDFTHPRNRIVAFKDFLNGRSLAYDDNGHGTHVWSLKQQQFF